MQVWVYQFYTTQKLTDHTWIGSAYKNYFSMQINISDTLAGVIFPALKKKHKLDFAQVLSDIQENHPEVAQAPGTARVQAGAAYPGGMLQHGLNVATRFVKYAQSEEELSGDDLIPDIAGLTVFHHMHIVGPKTKAPQYKENFLANGARSDKRPYSLEKDEQTRIALSLQKSMHHVGDFLFYNSLAGSVLPTSLFAMSALKHWVEHSPYFAPLKPLMYNEDALRAVLAIGGGYSRYEDGTPLHPLTPLLTAADHVESLQAQAAVDGS